MYSQARRTREPNLYGYIGPGRAPCASAQLQALLKLQNNDQVFRTIKRNIMRLITKHLDLNIIGSAQTDKLRTIEAELKEQNPEIFATEESKKRLYFATRLVLREHTYRRARHLKQIRRGGSAASQKPSIITRIKEKNRESKVESKHEAKPKSEPIVVDDDHEMSVEPVSHILSQSKELRAGSERDNPGVPKSASQTFPRSNESSTGTKSEITHKKHDPNQYKEINDFLKITIPPMTHLLDAFIDFGCVNAEYLRAVSSWSFEGIRGVLDGLSLGSDRSLTEMEKFILQNHFKEYFTQLKKGGNTINKSDS